MNLLQILGLAKIHNKHFYYFILFQVFFTNSYACDVCGCFMGITPYDNQGNIGIVYRYRSFNGYKGHEQKSRFFPQQMTVPSLPNATGNTETFINRSPNTQKKGFNSLPQPQHGGDLPHNQTFSEKDYELYQVYELRAKYFIHPRIEINTIAPVNQIKSLIQQEYMEHVGLGDISFFGGYHAIKKIEEPVLQQRLIIGAGVKIPTGNYYAENKGKRIDLLLQPGTGSIDYFGYFNYILGYKKVGFSTLALVKWNGNNYYKEQLMPSVATYGSFFYKILYKNWTIIPSAQAYYEYTNGLKINNKKVDGTEMNSLIIGPGLDVFYKNISFNFAFQRSIFDRAAVGNLNGAGRLIAGITYNFKQKKYLLKKG